MFVLTRTATKIKDINLVFATLRLIIEVKKVSCLLSCHELTNWRRKTCVWSPQGRPTVLFLSWGIFIGWSKKSICVTLSDSRPVDSCGKVSLAMQTIHMQLLQKRGNADPSLANWWCLDASVLCCVPFCFEIVWLQQCGFVVNAKMWVRSLCLSIPSRVACAGYLASCLIDWLKQNPSAAMP